MKIAMGSDHGGFALKQHLKTYLENKGCLVEDCGTDSTQSCDYPTSAVWRRKPVGLRPV